MLSLHFRLRIEDSDQFNFPASHSSSKKATKARPQALRAN
jgi:hypothetical protein